MRAPFAALAVVLALLASHAAAAVPEHSCLPSSTQLASPRPLFPSASEKMQYLAGYRSPYVIGLRTTLRDFVRGHAGNETRRSLAPFGKNIARDPFVVLAINANDLGGDWITVRFLAHTQALYAAWVYMLGGSTPSLRALKTTACSAAEQHYLAVRYAPLYALGSSETLIHKR